MSKWGSLSWRSLRFRLIGWYVLLLVLTLLVFSVYIFFQFRDLQQAQQDAALQAASTNVRGLLDPGRAGGPGGSGGNGGLTIRPNPGPPGIIQDLNRGNIQVRVLNREGKVTDSLGTLVAEIPLNVPTESGFSTVNSSDGRQWRIYSQPVNGGREAAQTGWLQVGQQLFSVNTELNRLFAPILLGTLIALLLAILGGLFLANQALRPIDRVTRTAQSISTQELSRRIHYTGPADEIGRLAKTLDQMLERLEKGFEQERRFTSDASHELRTPLTALKGRIEVTLSRPRSFEEYQETLGVLGQEVNRLIRLSSSLLYLARLDQTSQGWQSETLDLSDLLDSLLETMEPVAELKQIELSGSIPAGLHLQGNLDQLTRLFLNLLDNAIKYTPEGGKVKIGVERLDKRVAVSVSDNGPGIAPEHLPHLFERFYRAEADRASQSGGAGLGLAIASEIARQHNGTLEVMSQPGKGTTLKVQLPLAEVMKQK